MNRLFPLLIAGLTGLSAHAQTVGLFLNGPEAFDGYTLVAPTGATRTHLIDNCGRIVNQWDSEFRTGESAYLLENGDLLRTARMGSTVFNGGGIGGRIERFNWDGDLLWSYELATDTAHHHHDMAVLPNGNIVLMCWEYKSPEEAAAMGRESEGQLWPPMLVEIQPEGDSSGTVVWEWHAWDHLVQDSDAALPNWGVPAEHPTRFDVNYGQVTGGGLPGGSSGGDWFHCNGLDYNETLDHLMLNSRNWNEFYIIDHGTTTEEAAGPAGDLLYRWGNPQTYGRGNSTDRALYQQHDAHWLLGEGPAINGHDPNFTALVYNNGNGRPSGDGSSVDELVLPWDAQEGRYVLPPENDLDQPFLPDTLDWAWPELPDMNFHSHNISGAQRQQNGNTLICEGNKGRLFEITPEGDIVWEYFTAYNQFGAIVQGDNPFGNSTFRAYRYAPDYPAFDGLDLTPGLPVESNPLPFDCTLYPAPIDTTTNGVQENAQTLRWGPNPSDRLLSLNAEQPFAWQLSDLSGRTVLSGNRTAQHHTIDVSLLPSGTLILLTFDRLGHPVFAPQRILIRH